MPTSNVMTDYAAGRIMLRVKCEQDITGYIKVKKTMPLRKLMYAY